MESKPDIKGFPCRIHPKEVIQRVSVEEANPSPLLCVECIMDNDFKGQKEKVIHLKDYLEKVVAHYKDIREITTSSEEVPSTLTDFLPKEAEATANLSAFINAEKKEVNTAFDQILEQMTSLLEQKRALLLKDLDDQILNLALNYRIYKDKINKYYRGVNELVEVDLPKFISKINTFDTTSSLENYLKIINNDMMENASILSKNKTKDVEERRKKRTQGAFRSLEEAICFYTNKHLYHSILHK